MLFILGADFGIAMLTALLIATRPNPARPDRWLIATALMLAIITGGLGLARADIALPGPAKMFFGGPGFLTLFALLYFYVRDAVGRLRLRDALWLAPAALHFAWLWMIGEAQGFNIYVGGILWVTENNFLWPLPLLFPLIAGFVFPLLALRDARDHLAASKNRLSSLDGITLEWAAQLQIAVLGAVTLAAGSIATFGADMYVALCIVMAILGAFVLTVCIFGMRQRATVTPNGAEQITALAQHAPAREESPPEKTPAPSLDHLNQALEKDRAYAIEDYSLEMLADQAGLAPEQVTGALRANGLNFYDYVNRRRVSEAKSLLCDPAYASVSILTLAHDAGFQSKATFNRVFKRETGVTPTRFREDALNPPPQSTA